MRNAALLDGALMQMISSALRRCADADDQQRSEMEGQGEYLCAC